LTIIETVYKQLVRPRVFSRSADNAEIAHEWGMAQLKRLQRSPLLRRIAESLLVYDHPMLRVQVFGETFRNPLGLAAGFDKYCEVYWGAIPATGWGFAEIGGITPERQAGFPQPRMHRAPDYQAIWNQMGFNNPGKDAARRTMMGSPKATIPIGLNIGKGKDTPLELSAQDYQLVVAALGELVDFVTINISSPNTKDLRNLQSRAYLLAIIRLVQETARSFGLYRLPIGIKISPDEPDEQLADIVSVAMEAEVAFMILTNTTVKRNLPGHWDIPADRGGVSGEPLAPAAQHVLREVYRATKGRIPLIGVGGIKNGADLYERILNGATLCQAYTAWPYEGPDFVRRSLKDLVSRLRSDGFTSVSQAVGKAHSS
jgi:dihydroorotate dehydrogenase